MRPPAAPESGCRIFESATKLQHKRNRNEHGLSRAMDSQSECGYSR